MRGASFETRAGFRAVSNHGYQMEQPAGLRYDPPKRPAASMPRSPQHSETNMARLTKPLYQINDGRDEDRWRLVFDTETRRLFVEHEMTRGDMRGRGYSIETDELELAEYFSEDGPGQHELVRLLGALFQEEFAEA